MFTFLSRYWWVLVVRGLLAIILGVCAFAWPGLTIAVLATTFGFTALADGIFSIGSAIAGRKLATDWWVLLLEGLLGIAIGLLAIANPAMTAVFLLVMIALWAMGLGVLQIVAAVKLRASIPGEWWLGFGGLLGIVFGMLLLRYPAQGALAVLGLIGAFALVWGVTLIVAGIKVHRFSQQAA